MSSSRPCSTARPTNKRTILYMLTYFICEGDLDTVTNDFGKHCTEEHGIEYQKETITKFMLNK